MIGFILAAGFGTRLSPLTDHVPKALVSVCGVPLLKRAYDFFKANAITRVAINSHHHPEQVGSFVKGNFPDVTIFHEQGSIRGTGGALVFSRQYLESDEAFCVANVDIITNADIAELARDFLQSPACVGLVAAPSKNGTIRFNAETGEFSGTRTQKERGKPAVQNALEKSADFIGITFYKKEFLSVLKEDDFNIIPVWGRAREKGMKVKVIETGPVYWNDVGRAQSLAKIHFDVLDRTVDIPLPASIIIDYKDKKAYQQSLGTQILPRVGPYSWIDAPELPDESTFSHAVIFQDANVPDGVAIEHAIVTKYGVMSLDS